MTVRLIFLFIIRKNNLLLIHRLRGPPSPLGKATEKWRMSATIPPVPGAARSERLYRAVAECILSIGLAVRSAAAQSIFLFENSLPPMAPCWRKMSEL